MIFGKIDYLNLLPFHMFLKKRLKSSSERCAWQRHGSVPSSVNRAFFKRRVDAAVISSIKSQGLKCTDMGIIADGEVRSVLLIPGDFKKDKESDTSNSLAKVLNLKGEILIGDKALHYYLNNRDSQVIDLALKWKKRYNLPFVFARLCAHPRYINRVEKLSKEFLSKPTKIPIYILRQKAAQHNIPYKELEKYLSLIKYKMGWREKRALKKFLTLAKNSSKAR